MHKSFIRHASKILSIVLVSIVSNISLAQNYGFEAPAATPPQGWTPVTGTWSTVSATVNPNFVRTGNQAVSITDPATTGTTIGNTVPTVVTSAPGSWLISMAWARANVSDNARLHLGYRSGTTNTLNPANTNAGQPPNLNAQGWKRLISVSANPVPAGSYSPAMRAFRTNATANTTLYIDDFIIYASASPVPDTIAPSPVTNVNIAPSGGNLLTWNNGQDQGNPPSGLAGVVIIRAIGQQAVAPQLNDQAMYAPEGGAAGVRQFTENGVEWTVVAATNNPVEIFNDTSAIAGLTYTYAVYARDRAFNYSIGTVASSSGPVDMSYLSGTTIQQTGNVEPGAVNQAIIRIQIIMAGSLNPLSATAMQLSTNGSTNAASDILAARLFYTGNSAVFATTEQIGSTVSNPSGTFVINFSKQLLPGLNNFWLAYDVAPNATVNNFLDAECLSYTIAGQTYTPSVTAPPGNRRIVAAMSGIYTIGGTNPDYVNIASAVSDMKQLGLSGAVIFNIRPGTYSGQYVLENIPGISETNTVTFRAENGDSSSVVIQHPSSALSEGNYVFLLNNISHIRLHKLTITRTGTEFNSNIIVLQNTNRIHITNCRLLGNDASTSTSNLNGIGIVVPTGFSANNTRIERNYFTGVNGVVLRGVSTSNTAQGNVVQDNVFRVFYTAIQMADQAAPIITRNDIRRNNPTSTFISYGVNLERCGGNARITRNKIYALGGQRGIRLFFCEAGSGNEIIVANNIIQTGGTSINYGITVESNSKNVAIYFNTVYVQSTTTVDTDKRGIFIDGAASTNIKIANNCVYMQTGGYCIFTTAATAPTITYTNYNNYFANTGSVLAFWGSPQPNLQALKTASGKEQNSLSVNPQFVSVENMTPENEELFGAGIYLTEVTDDFFGAPRNAGGPTIGAIEVAPVAIDAALIQVLGVASQFCSSTNLTVRLVVRNTGLDTIKTINAGARLTGPSVITLSNTFTNLSIPYNKIDTLTLGTFSVTVPGTYVGKAFIQLPGDLLPFNDTLTNANILVKPSQEPPTAATPSQIVCAGSSVFLAASGQGQVRWYADNALNTLVGLGDSLQLGPINNNTTYYAVIDNLVLPERAGLLQSGNTGAFITSQPGWGMNFTVAKRLELTSVHVYPTGTGTIRLLVANTNNQVVFSGPVVNISGNGSQKIPIPIGAELNPGNYRLLMQYSGITNLARESTGFAFPYTSPSGALVITSSQTGTQANTNFYYWFYDWNIKISSGCPGITPVPVQLGNVPPTPLFTYRISSSTVQFINLTNSGSTYSWNFGDGVGTSTEVNPTYTYAASGIYNVQLTADNACTDPVTFTKTVNIVVTDLHKNVAEGQDAKAYPVPAHDLLYVVLPKSASTVGMYDVFGREVGKPISVTDDVAIFRTAHLPAGQYIIKIRGTQFERVLRITVAH